MALFAGLDTSKDGQPTSPGINFKFNPTLASRAAINITISLWYHEDIFKVEILHACKPKSLRQDACIEKVVKNAESLLIPQILKESIIVLIRPIKNQLVHWMKINKRFLSDSVMVYSDISWTSIGLIDCTETARNIIRRGNLAPIDAFNLACVNCVFEDINAIYPMVKSHKNLEGLFPAHEEISFWVSLAQSGVVRYDSLKDHCKSFQLEYSLAFSDANLSVLKFFFDKYNVSEKKVFFDFVERSKRNIFIDNKPLILLFLLSYMDGDEQDLYLKKDPFHNLFCFLHWPLQLFFLQVADKLAERLTEPNFCKIVKYIIMKVRMFKNEASLYRNEASLYRNFFTGFWTGSPANLKIFYMQKHLKSHFKQVFSPMLFERVLDILFSGACDEQTLYKSLLHNGNAVICFLLEENKAEGFKILVQDFIPTDKTSKERFEKSYDACSQYYCSSFNNLGFPVQNVQ